MASLNPGDFQTVAPIIRSRSSVDRGAFVVPGVGVGKMFFFTAPQYGAWWFWAKRARAAGKEMFSA